MNHEPSQTALLCAAGRAAHLRVDGNPRILADTFAEVLLGERAEDLLNYHRVYGDHPIMADLRAQVVCRARYVEDQVVEAVRQGIGQYVILGAGLDSFGHRSECGPTIRIFEADHPSTQRWKLARLAEAGIPIPETVHHVPVDLEADDLVEALRTAGFDPAEPAIVSWLGVTMYLTRQAVEDIVAQLAGLAGGTQIVVDYLLPDELRDESGRQYARAVAAAVTQGGEPWLSYFTPDSMAELLARRGLDVVEDVPQRDMVDASLWRRDDALHPADLLHLTRARVGC